MRSSSGPPGCWDAVLGLLVPDHASGLHSAQAHPGTHDSRSGSLAPDPRMVHSHPMAPASYSDVILENIRAVRARRQLDQADVSERMRALGYTSWHRQTLGK